MAELSESSDQEIIDELLGRESFTGAVLTPDPNLTAGYYAVTKEFSADLAAMPPHTRTTFIERASESANP